MSKKSIDKENPEPIYYQIKEALKEKIEDGALEPGQRLPSEKDLEKKYNISRMTARRALSELESEGYAYREQGKGSFVADANERQKLPELAGFSQDMEDRGIQPGARILESKIFRCDSELEKKLDMRRGDQIFYLKRVRLADGEPLAIETSHLRYSLCKGIEEYEFSNRSLYSTLREDFNLELSYAKQTVQAASADEFIANNLVVEQGEPMLMTERTTFIESKEVPIEYVRSVYRGDRYKLFVELSN